MNFTVLVPIHNEENFLRYSLPSVVKMKPHQLILIFDRCSDNSLQKAKEIINKLDYSNKLKIITVKKRKWKWQLFYLVYLAIEHSENDILFIVGADTMISNHSKVLQIIANVFDNKKNAWLGFGWIDYPLTFQTWIKYILQKYHLIDRIPCGLNYLFRTSLIEKEVFKKWKNTVLNVDTLLKNRIANKGYETLFQLEPLMIHLRPQTNKKLFLSGFIRYIHGSRLKNVLFFSMIYFRPMILAGFLKAKFMGLRQRQNCFM